MMKMGEIYTDAVKIQKELETNLDLLKKEYKKAKDHKFRRDEFEKYLRLLKYDVEKKLPKLLAKMEELLNEEI